jgi:hypothetical protein
MHLTESAIAIIDGYRQALGKSTLEDRRKSVRDRWDAAIHRGVEEVEAEDTAVPEGKAV